MEQIRTHDLAKLFVFSPLLLHLAYSLWPKLWLQLVVNDNFLSKPVTKVRGWEKASGQFHQHLSAAFTQADPKRAKRYWQLIWIFTLLGFAHVKAVHINVGEIDPWRRRGGWVGYQSPLKIVNFLQSQAFLVHLCLSVYLSFLWPGQLCHLLSEDWVTSQNISTFCCESKNLGVRWVRSIDVPDF